MHGEVVIFELTYYSFCSTISVQRQKIYGLRKEGSLYFSKNQISLLLTKHFFDWLTQEGDYYFKTSQNKNANYNFGTERVIYCTSYVVSKILNTSEDE